MIDLQAMPHMADIPRVQAERRPDAVAMWFKGEETTYAEFDKRTNQVGNGLLALNVKPNDRVGYLAKNTDSYYEILFGCTKIRAALNGVNVRLAPAEIAYILSDAQVSVLFVGPEFYGLIRDIMDQCPKLEHVICIGGADGDWPDYAAWREGQSSDAPGLKTEDDDDVIQLYTSGTTGLPKGVMLTNANYADLFDAAASQEWASYKAGDVVMNAMPLFHVAGCNSGILALAQGAKTVVVPDIVPTEILDLIEQQKINHAMWVPAVILMLSQMPDFRTRDYSSLQQVFYGASPITEDLLKLAMEVMEARFTQLYGLTETCGMATFLPPEAHDPGRGKLRSCGIGYPDRDVLCVDEDGKPVATGEVGEIVVKAGFVMKGYWNRPEATANAIKNGYFYTGDAGYMDEEGFVYIHDRMKDMIISGGENIYPAEVENAIFGHPDVADVAVIGIPDDRWGETVKAVVVPKPGQTPSPESVIAWARERIAAYKCPKSVDFIEAMPRNPSGKILRKDLRKPYWEGIGRNVS